jgi:hypothetical protein
MPELATKYLNCNSILALNPVSRRKIVVYRTKKRFTSGFYFYNFFSKIFKFKVNFEKNSG